MYTLKWWILYYGKCCLDKCYIKEKEKNLPCWEELKEWAGPCSCEGSWWGRMAQGWTPRWEYNEFSVQFSSVAQSCPALCDPMDCSTPGLPVYHQLPELAQTYLHWVSNAIQPAHPLSSPSPPAFNLSQNQGLFQWVSSSYQVAKALEFQLQHQSFQWTPRTDFL